MAYSKLAINVLVVAKEECPLKGDIRAAISIRYTTVSVRLKQLFAIVGDEFRQHQGREAPNRPRKKALERLKR